MAQLMPLPLTVSCFSKIQIGFTFLVPAHPGSPGQRAVKCVCSYTLDALYIVNIIIFGEKNLYVSMFYLNSYSTACQCEANTQIKYNTHCAKKT